MKQILERELKLVAPVGYVIPRLPGVPIKTRRFTSTYFDSQDLRLAGLQITLRRRVENRRGLWQLKIPRGEDRLEIEEPGGPNRPPESILKLLTAVLHGRTLTPVAKMRTVRNGIVVDQDSMPVAEIVLDAVEVLDGRRVSQRFRELEVELLEGDTADLKDLEVTLKASGAEQGDGLPKAFRVLELSPPTKAAPKKGLSDLAIIQRAIADQFHRILSHDPGTRLGDEPEDLHQHRVGIRRLRSFLRAARSMLDPDWAQELRGELEWIGDLMNPVRDLDVMIPHFRMDLELLDGDEAKQLESFVQDLEDERDIARKAMLSGLESARYLTLIQALEHATQTLKVRPDSSGLKKGAVDEFRKLRKAVRAFKDDSSDEQMHRVRRLGKRARYAAELVEATDGKKVSKYLSKSKKVQDILGEHQDAAVAEAKARDHLSKISGQAGAFALGRLVEIQVARKRAARTDFPDAWRAVYRRGRKVWL
jgi:CHAD domain-containing protein